MAKNTWTWIFIARLNFRIFSFTVISSIAFPGFCISPVHAGDHAAGAVVRIPQLCDHDDREAVRDPLLDLRHRRLHVRDRQRRHRHIRLLPRLQEAHPHLDRHG